jgi:lipopolysaccharide export system permease protein
MKILDRYVIKQFLIGYVIAFCVLIGMIIAMDLFINLDEFAEHSDAGAKAVMMNILTFYGSRAALWFRDMAGVITVIAAVFSLVRMTRNNELIAIMASGMSLKRFITPIIAMAALLTTLQVLDQELLIPRITAQLTRSQDDMPGVKKYDLWFASDSNGNLICTPRFDLQTRTMESPFIILRKRLPRTDQFVVTGRIRATSAVYDSDRGGWVFNSGELLRTPDSSDTKMGQQTAKADFFESDLTPEQIPMRRQEGYKSLLSSTQLITLAQSQGTRQSDLAELYLQKHTRITDPILNLVMLLVALPVLVCRDPREMKTAIMVSFATSTSCFVLSFVCKMFATEVFFHQVRPELWAWAPIFIFVPIALIQLDSMKT